MSVHEVISKYYEFVNAGEWERWMELFDEHFVMDEQLAGHIEGRERLRAIVGNIHRVFSCFQNHPWRIVVDGKQAFVASHLVAASASGEPIKAEVANYFLVENGKIVYMSNFHDSKPFAPVLNQEQG